MFFVEDEPQGRSAVAGAAHCPTKQKRRNLHAAAQKGVNWAARQQCPVFNIWEGVEGDEWEPERRELQIEPPRQKRIRTYGFIV